MQTETMVVVVLRDNGKKVGFEVSKSECGEYGE
jgi:hypothetical protein